MSINILYFLTQKTQKQIFERIWIWSIIGSIGLLSACASSQPQPPKTSKPRPNPLRQLEIRVKAMETNQSKLIQKLQVEVDELKQNLKEFEQLKRNQNILLLDLQGKFDERMAQIEKELTQNKLRFGKQANKSEQPQQNMRDLQPTLGQGIAAPQTAGPSKSGTTELPPQPLVTASSSSSKASSVPPVNIDQIFETGWDLHKKKQYLKAIEIFQKFRKTYPQHPNAIEAHYLIGDSYFSLEDYQNAAVEFFDFVDQNPQYPSTYDAQWKLAQSLEKSGEVGLALDVYQELAQGSSFYREEAQKSLKRYEQK